MQKISEADWNYWYDCVYAYFYRRVSNRIDVEDLTMETLETYFLYAKEIESKEAFIWGIAKRKMLEYIRRKDKTKVSTLDENYEEKSFSNEFNLKLENLKKCIQSQLSNQDQEIIEMSVMSDFSSQNVAEKLNLTAANVRQKLSRSIKKLRQKCRQVWTE
jgi:RNA polymerase sigma factor (sigma-70 family)